MTQLSVLFRFKRAAFGISTYLLLFTRIKIADRQQQKSVRIKFSKHLLCWLGSCYTFLFKIRYFKPHIICNFFLVPCFDKIYKKIDLVFNAEQKWINWKIVSNFINFNYFLHFRKAVYQYRKNVNICRCGSK